MSTRLAWGILGTGSIANTFAKAVAASTSGTLVAVGSRTKAAADTFAKQFKIPAAHAHGSYQALLDDVEVKAVYISMPHNLHAEWAIKAAAAGKHILCEKPLAVNHAEAMAMVEAAIKNDVFLMEAFMYRCHPQTAKLVELIKNKTIGEVQSIQATFSFHSNPAPDHRLVANELAGGGILDVGCYTASICRLIAGAASGKDFADPFDVKGHAHLGVTRVDDYAVATMKFPGDILAQLACGVRLEQGATVRIYGSKGSIVVPTPFVPGRDAAATKLIITRSGQKEAEEIAIAPPTSLYVIEADTVAANVAKRQATAMSWEDSLGNMRTLDRWREAVGLVYDFEKPEACVVPLGGKPLSVVKPTQMKYGQIAGVAKPVARLVMGVDNQNSMPHAAAMFDDYFARGGNCFDTANIYGAQREKLLGQWLRNRGVREQVVLISKGAHTPNCNPVDLSKQLIISLANLQVDHADLYFLHRDNLDIPVGEFVDVLNQHLKAGRIRAFGGSNWSIARIEAANQYAKAKGLQGFAAFSNNFSLARMVDPVWGGCIAASDAESRAWLAKSQLPLFAWSSQARGFFTDRANPADKSDAEMVRCWHSDDNWKRRDRVLELAKKRGVLPINIALAYVLCQPFPVFPLIGPRQLSETRTTWPALTVELSPGELRWLNLEADSAR